MKILVLGATGATGRAFAQAALFSGHEVTALVRDPTKVTVEGAKLRVVQGDVYRPPSLDAVMAGQDVVVFCVGPGAGVKQSKLRTDGMRNTLASMSKAGVRRLIALSRLGAGVSRQGRGFLFDKIMAPFVLGAMLEDFNGMEAEIRKTKLDWVVVRPGEMTDVEGKGKWVISLDGSGITPTVSRGDVVLFLQSLLEGEEYLRKTPSIGY
jgi:putative NADH-flavin reductase